MVLGVLERWEDVYRHAVSFSHFALRRDVSDEVSLAMAEMTTLVAAIYRRYHTSIGESFEDTTPAITARVEIFCEERFRAMRVSSLRITSMTFSCSFPANRRIHA